MMPVSSDLLTRWLSSDLDVSQQAFKEIKSLGQGALPVLREAISTGSSMQLAACRLVLEMDEYDVRELVLPLFARREMMADLLSVIAGAKVGLPCVWPSLTGALREPDRRVRLRGLDAVQSQITRAKIEELCFDEWAVELMDPMAELAGNHDFYVSVKAAELISRLPIKSEAIARALEANVPRFLDEKQAGLSYLAKALMAQVLSDETKANALGYIMRRGIYRYDRFVASLCAGELGVSARSLLPECQNVLDSMSTGKPSGSRAQLKHLREAMELIQCTTGKDSSKGGKTYNHPRLQMWMDAMETEEYSCSSSTHLLSTIAREQIRRSRDESLVGPIIEALSGKVSPDHYQHLLLVLNCLLSNTGNAELRDWLRRECGREDLKPKQIGAMLYVNQPEVMPLVRRVLFANKGVYANRCLDHLKRDASDESVDLLCEVGRRDPSLRLLVIFGLEETSSLRAIPYLLELAKRDLESKKQEELEWRAYAILALGKIGDSSVVPELSELMEQRGPSTAVLCALADLGDSRGLVPAIRAVSKILANSKTPSSWSDGYRTPVYNLFLLARKCGQLDDPQLVALFEEIRRNGVWNKLLPQERAFLASLHCAPS